MDTPPTIHHMDEVGSTQQAARRLVAETGTVPLLLTAGRQTAGRGRMDRTWLSAPRALACSLALRPRWFSRDWPRIPLVAGLMARAALGDVGVHDVGLKWPNDLVVDSGKVGGILVESVDGLVIIGLGLNLWWPDAPDGVAAIHDDDPGSAFAGAIAESWARAVDKVLLGEPSLWGRDNYRAACVTLGASITWEPDGTGQAVDIAPDGALVVETGDGRISLRAGEVHTVRPTTLSLRNDGNGGEDAR